jgi:BirA family transcriptional regulator, biotin operon repressor / biotin---[acetyl-CoA-carboxylase] ligase
LATPYDIVQLTETPSTQDEASDRFDETGVATLVIADRQLEGRGRQGRTWVQPDRALYSSLAFHNAWPMDRKTLIPLMTADAVAHAIVEACGVEVELKWPNDILVHGSKVGGILVETSGDRVTVGCGLNLWWLHPLEGAEALFDDDPGRPTAIDLANGWVHGLLRILDDGQDGWDPSGYLDRSVTVTQRVVWDDGEGVATGIGPDGSLIVQTETGSVAIHAGDVHLRGSH